jgi:hypothetical protein
LRRSTVLMNSVQPSLTMMSPVSRDVSRALTGLLQLVTWWKQLEIIIFLFVCVSTEHLVGIRTEYSVFQLYSPS